MTLILCVTGSRMLRDRDLYSCSCKLLILARNGMRLPSWPSRRGGRRSGDQSEKLRIIRARPPPPKPHLPHVGQSRLGSFLLDFASLSSAPFTPTIHPAASTQDDIRNPRTDHCSEQLSELDLHSHSASASDCCAACSASLLGVPSHSSSCQGYLWR